MGLLVGVVLYPIINETNRHRIIVWAFRLAAIPIAVVLFVVLIRNFYTSDPYAGTVTLATSNPISHNLPCSLLLVSVPLMLPHFC